MTNSEVIDKRAVYVGKHLKYADDMFKSSKDKRIDNIVLKLKDQYPGGAIDAFSRNRERTLVALALDYHDDQWERAYNTRRLYFQDSWEERMKKEENNDYKQSRNAWLSSSKKCANLFVRNFVDAVN